MDVKQLRKTLFDYIASKENPKLSYNWDTTAQLLGIDIIQLEYLIDEIGDDYFIQNKSGFIPTTKAIVEAKYSVQNSEKADNQINYIGVNYGTANQGRDFDIRDQNFSNNPPNQNISTKSQKSFWQKTLQFIVDNIVKIVVGVIIGLLAIYLGLKKD
ncbi:MAG: hypothetical protein U1C70_14370 [Sediminibacterium sp.]|uniref:hypothetical protein n=1 Tax=Sediminibacterium sp. TaxID=1917865 RepID=UPI002AB988BC|nr:hypothetical protein [Sediminibacterium sp.]MDZ4073004.1 hypothetical protein [Sediminibacterium sp.]